MTAEAPETEAPAPEVESPLDNLEKRTEAERLDPQPTPGQFKSGTPFAVEPLRLRQFLAMLRILTRGAATALMMGGLQSRDGEDFARQLMATLLFAIPEAEQETIDFIKAMTRPQLDPKDENYAHMKELLDEELDNPELEDVVAILEMVVTTEGEDLRALGNRLRSMFATAQKMGLAPNLTD